VSQKAGEKVYGTWQNTKKITERTKKWNKSSINTDNRVRKVEREVTRRRTLLLMMFDWFCPVDTIVERAVPNFSRKASGRQVMRRMARWQSCRIFTRHITSLCRWSNHSLGRDVSRSRKWHWIHHLCSVAYSG